jgi:hypothetical protein
MVGEEIFSEIDTTLDQLIKNAEAMCDAEVKELSEAEIDGFQKTQESLIHHLLHMDQLLDTKRKGFIPLDRRSAHYKIQQKRLRFEKLKTNCHKTLSPTITERTLLSKRRHKNLIRSLDVP